MKLINAITLAMCAISQAAPPDFKYVKRETRQETRDATLAQYMPEIQWGPWHVIGPFDDTEFKKHNVVYPPELKFSLQEEYPGKNASTAKWEVLKDVDWPLFDLRYGNDDLNKYAIAYLHREATAMADGTLDVELGSDDGLKLWMNGKLLIDADVPRGLDPQDHRIALPIRKGHNELLVKVTQGVGGWEFQMRPVIDQHVLALLEYHLNRDFPTSPEDRHYRILTVLEPSDVVLEVGGLAVMPDGRPIVSTRRGDVWIVEGAYDDPPFNAKFKRFASGLHEPLGGQWRDGGFMVVQRGELTRLVDRDGDDRADLFQTVSDQWGVSGNYHEFAFGPKYDGQGRTWVTLNVGFCGSLGKSTVPWRGWAMIVNEKDGSLTPVCGGLRSPNGIGRNAAGDMFFTDNQGDWVGTNKLSHLDFGDWHGHPAGDRWYAKAGMKAPDGESSFKQAAVWFPYDRMGRSASDILLDDTAGKFGPFQDQLFVGDQYSALVMRVYLEKVNGVYQGACFGFRSGLDCGVNRMAFGPDGSMFVGETNRGWWSIGSRPYGLQRLVYTGILPFEIREMKVLPDGFSLTFTKPVDANSANDVASYSMSSFTHHRWEKYGSPEIEQKDHSITLATVAPNGLSVRLRIDGLRTPYVHELRCAGVRSRDGEKLLHDVGYYTLNQIPTDGQGNRTEAN